MQRATWKRMLGIAILVCGVAGSFADDAKTGVATSEPVAMAALPMDFAPVGARSMGVGLAFTAIADDLTAAEVNPAGLAGIDSAELSVHGRTSANDAPLMFPGAEQALASANFFRSRSPQNLAPLSAATSAGLDETVSSLSFAGVAYPFERWTLSAYGSETRSLEGTHEVVVDDPFFSDTYRTLRSVDTAIRSVGLAAAVQLNERVSLGVSVRQTTFEMAAFEEYQIDYFRDFEFPSATFDHVDTLIDRSLIDDDDTDITYTVGVLFSPSPVMNVGLSFRAGGEYELSGRSLSASCTDFPGQGSCDPSDPETYTYDSDPAGDPFGLEIVVPDVAQIGVAWRPRERLALAVEVHRLLYAQGRYISADDFGEISLDRGGEPEVSEAPADTLEEIEDANQFHFGIQYEFAVGAGDLPFAVRGGAFNDPDHDGSSELDTDRMHYAVGCGLTLQHVAIDLAAHFADSVDEVLLSLAYRF
ncbi:MAG: hypothetical protein GY716_23275 [bacterium]|nr:hypothetical protein [bacterium]